MRLFGHLIFWWVTSSTAAALVIGRLLRNLPTPPPPVDDWTPVAVDREFAAIVAEWAQR